MRNIKTILLLLVLLVIPYSYNTTSTKADTKTFYDSVENQTEDQDGYMILKAETTDELLSAIAQANELATQTKPYKIVVKPSDSPYVLSRCLSLYSNIYLYARGATFQQTKGLSNNMLRLGNDDNKVGYYYKNITIDGGIWNENNNSNTLAKFAQAQNVTIQNATFQNVKNGHLIEIAGVTNLTIRDCTFKNQVPTSKKLTCYEAIQLDILVDGHIMGYRFQDLATKNVSVTNCMFDNVPRGIGSHTTVLNNPIDTITIQNNVFQKNTSCAVQLLNVKNCIISHNTITDSPRGISIFGAVAERQHTYLAKTVAAQENTKTSTPSVYQTPAKNMKINILANSIKISGTDPYASYERSGIFVGGYNATTATKNSSGDKMPKGNYYVSGVRIQNNVIKGNANGIKVEDIRNTIIANNTAQFTGSMGKQNLYGVACKNKTKTIAILQNTLTGHLNGIYLKDAGAANISNNIIRSVKKYGISIERSTAADLVANNIANIPVNAIYLKDSTAGNLTKNTIATAKKYGISVERSTAGSITKNRISKIKVNGIHIWNKSKVKNVTKNTITSAKKRGIYMGGKSKATSIKTNKFKSCKQKMYVNKDSKVSKK